ncbi:MAG: glycoside hydrolase family 3 N-terminal domain-containing protein [Pseudomonadota bacterium]
MSLKPKALIVAPEGYQLKKSEKKLYQKHRPFGFILFSRNIKDPQQTKRLCDDLRMAISDSSAPIFIDQEGGRVQRMQPPNWPQYKAASYFAELFKHNPINAKEALLQQTKMIAKDLWRSGINANCAPVCDLFYANGDAVISDRAYGGVPSQVIELANIVAKTYMEVGIYPVIKHIPGHGLANVDSHLELPVVKASLEELEQRDFLVFKALKHYLFAMSAHIVYQALDPDACVTCSTKAIHYIRNEIGFNGLLMSDDLSMGALKDKTKINDTPVWQVPVFLKALKSGCDLGLYCAGDFAESRALLDAAPEISDEAWQKWQQQIKI